MDVLSNRRVFLALVAAALVSGRPALAQGHDHKIDRSLEASLRSGATTQKVIVTVEDPVLRAGIRRALVAHGDVITANHPMIDAFAAEVHSEDVYLLANHAGVRAVSADAAVGAVSAFLPTASSSAPQGGSARDLLGLLPLSNANAPRGQGIGIALIDSGISPTSDVNVSAFFDFTRGGIPVAPFDDYGHGTFIAGLIGSNGSLSAGQFPGIAPAVNFVGLKVLDKTGQGTTSDVIKAIEYVTANRARLRVQIINLSLGHPIFAKAADDPLARAVERASASGLIVVVAAGNNGQNRATGVAGYAGINSPGNARSAITVGAVTTQDTRTLDDDRVANYSSRGPSWYDGIAKPDVVAPGTMLIAEANVNSYLYKTLLTSHVTSKNGRQFLELSGTSMATGVVSGLVALMLESQDHAGYSGDKPMTANLAKAILEYTAIPLHDAAGVLYDVLTQGAGAVNANGAVALSNAIDTSARRGSWWLRNSVPSQTVIAGQPYTWARNIVWGDNVVSGDLLFRNLTTWSLNIVWGDNIVWGSNIVWGDNIVWSDVAHLDAANIVWGDNIVWGSNIVWGNSVDQDNIVWGSLNRDNIVWGSLDDNIVWGSNEDNIVWGDNVVWGSALPTPSKPRVGGLF